MALTTFFCVGAKVGETMDGVAAIIVAAGTGSRMGTNHPVKKQFRTVGGRTLLEWSVTPFERACEIGSIVVVTLDDEALQVKQALETAGISKLKAVVAGGRTRAESVACGLRAVPDEAEWVVVHDGARPLVSTALIRRVLQQAKKTGAATVGLPVTDTVKRVEPGGRIVETVDRSNLWAVQTPQAFKKSLLLQAHRERDPNRPATDDASLVEATGNPVHIVSGDPRNVKVTTEADLELVRLWLEEDRGPTEQEREEWELSTGFGFDVHRLVPGRPLILGGVRLEHSLGLDGHSDADVLTHAVMDALLGAASLGDIGTHFPDTDPKYKGADSVELLRVTGRLLADARCTVLHLDVFVSAEAPKLKPHIPTMRQLLAEALGVHVDRVSIKAGTGEGVGPVGRQEAIEARAVATLRRPAPR